MTSASPVWAPLPAPAPELASSSPHPASTSSTAAAAHAIRALIVSSFCWASDHVLQERRRSHTRDGQLTAGAAMVAARPGGGG
jgi:hypothetical protein